MKRYLMYVCEKCGFESRNYDEVDLCEAKHMGLNDLNDKHKYDELVREAEQCGRIRGCASNAETRAAFDKAIEELVQFEKEHNMSN